MPVINLPIIASPRHQQLGLIFKSCAEEERGIKEAIVTKKSSH